MRCNRKKDDIVSRLPYWFNILYIKAFKKCPFQVSSRVLSCIVVTVQRGFNLVIWFTTNYRGSEWNKSKYEADPLSAHQWFPVACWQMRKSLVPSLEKKRNHCFLAGGLFVNSGPDKGRAHSIFNLTTPTYIRNVRT